MMFYLCFPELFTRLINSVIVWLNSINKKLSINICPVTNFYRAACIACNAV